MFHTLVVNAKQNIEKMIEYKKAYEGWMKKATFLSEENARLQQNNRNMKEALEKIRANNGYTFRDGCICQEIAKKALCSCDGQIDCDNCIGNKIPEKDKSFIKTGEKNPETGVRE